MQGIMLQVSCNSITLKNENETFHFICIRIFWSLFLYIFTWVIILMFPGEHNEFSKAFFNACAAIRVKCKQGEEISFLCLIFFFFHFLFFFFHFFGGKGPCKVPAQVIFCIFCLL